MFLILVQSCTAVRASATITQLVLGHALRIRVKAQTADEAASSDVSVVATPDTASAIEQPGSSTEAGGKSDPSKPTATSISGESTSMKTTADENKLAGGENFIGRLNNLVTTDINTMSNGVDWLEIGAVRFCVPLLVDRTDYIRAALYIPIQVAFCVVFLYSILGWRYARFINLCP